MASNLGEIKMTAYSNHGGNRSHNGNGSHGRDFLSQHLLDTFELDLDYEQDDTAIQDAVRTILAGVGEDPDREGLQRTPSRVARMYKELLEGYHINPEQLVNDALFDVDYQEMIVVRDIEYYSLCEHHLLPFIGKTHVAYIPTDKVIGLSKIPRVVDMFARRLQVQERMTQQIGEFLMQVLQPQGVAVVCEGIHMCSMMRGVKKANSSMVTSAMFGCFRESAKTRAEFFAHINRPHVTEF
jgi:GTP cyclohydrolase I